MRKIVALGASCLLLGVLAAGCTPSADEPRVGETRQPLAGDPTYVVLYKSASVHAKAKAKIVAAGGAVVYEYGAIGVVIASSSDPAFASKAAADPLVMAVSPTKGFAAAGGQEFASAGGASVAGATSAASGDPLSGLQWDMDQIKAPEAHAITGGTSSVIVGDIDTGADYTHPDLAPNIDFSRSVSCIGGVPNQDPAAWDDDVGHGTHTAGTIAAAANGIGIVGVAPNVKLAVIKAGDENNLFFPEAVICGFVWAATHGVKVTNSSFYVDPWLYNCRNDPGQRAIWIAIRRAVRYAMSNGVVVVNSAGNEFSDITHPTVDFSSPDYPPGSETEREVTNACSILPAELPGVITVGSTGNLNQKALYSNYGQGFIDVVAPGGDSFFQLTPAAPNGRVLSTWPAKFAAESFVVSDCSSGSCSYYRYMQGTSMAAPHATGVAALILSKSESGSVANKIYQSADRLACPANPFLEGTPFEATCTGGPGNNSFYGAGQLNALRAVSK
jgi:subtilisin family serine protease